jgi:hypothetical protein
MNHVTIWVWWYLTFLAIPVLVLGLLAKDPIMNVWHKRARMRNRRRSHGGNGR